MNQEKIGKFIAQLRKEKKLTQDELAAKIPITRQAVSKWERGKTIPDPQTLLVLSDIFEVNINELLYGERKNNDNNGEIDNVALDLYKADNNKKSIIKWLFSVLGIVIITFFVYYFINSYNSIKVYRINYSDENVAISNGILLLTREKIYFQLGNMTYDKKDDISKIELYYYENDNKKLICESYDSHISIMDYYQYNEYFSYDNILSIITNLYIDIYLKNEEVVEVKLDVTEDYKNNKLFFYNKKNIINGNSDNIEEKNLNINGLAIDVIKQKFEKTGADYYYKYDEDDSYIESIYNSEQSILSISVYNNRRIIDEWYFDFRLNTLDYSNYVNGELVYSISSFNNKNSCNFGECNNYNKIDEFYDILSLITEGN